MRKSDKTTATLWAQDGRIFIRTDYNKDFVDDFKQLVPGKHRSWKPKPEKVWTCEPAYLDDVHALAQQYFDEVSIVDSGASTEVDFGEDADAYRLLLRHCPDDYLKKIYHAVIAAVHPDKGGTQEQAIAVNAAWERIRSERGI